MTSTGSNASAQLVLSMRETQAIQVPAHECPLRVATRVQAVHTGAAVAGGPAIGTPKVASGATAKCKVRPAHEQRFRRRECVDPSWRRVAVKLLPRFSEAATVVRLPAAASGALRKNARSSEPRPRGHRGRAGADWLTFFLRWSDGPAGRASAVERSSPGLTVARASPERRSDCHECSEPRDVTAAFSGSRDRSPRSGARCHSGCCIEVGATAVDPAPLRPCLPRRSRPRARR